MQQLLNIGSSMKRVARRSALAAGGGVLLSIVGLGLAVGLQACSSDSESTTGKRVVLHTRVEVNDVALSEFTTAVGWNVTLTKAAVSAGPFYYFDGTPPLVLRDRQNSWQYAARVLGLGTAHAHPGHYQAGNAMGEMRESSSLDLFGGAADFPDGEGVTGTYRSARFTFSEPSGPAKKQLDGHVAVAVGVASKEGEPARYFRAFADLSTIEYSVAYGQIEGCELTEVDVEGDGTITVNVNPKIWFDLVDFSDAEEASEDAPADLPEGSQPQIAFVLGVTQLSAYKFSFSSP
jgi:hypothetical protein